MSVALIISHQMEQQVLALTRMPTLTETSNTTIPVTIISITAPLIISITMHRISRISSIIIQTNQI